MNDEKIEKPAKRVTRDRLRPIRVLVSEAERTEIERRAELAGLSRSGYLRTTGLNHPIRSTLDFQAVRDLVHVAGDLGRFGGLLKLWLGSRRGEAATVAEVNQTLKGAIDLQDKIRTLIGRV